MNVRSIQGQSLLRLRRGLAGDECPRTHRIISSCVCLPMALFALFAIGTGQARAQVREHALPTATRAGDLQIGGALALGSSNYNFSTSNFVGAAFYTTFDIRSHWGAEFNLHQNKSTQDSTVYERTYEIGPRVYVLKGSFAPYAKAMYGRGVYNFSNKIANIAYNIYTVGGGADLRVARSVNVRADYEYQTWPGFPLATLHPSVITLGVAFHFHE
jgi:opacity protein-like surface antigen